MFPIGYRPYEKSENSLDSHGIFSYLKIGLNKSDLC
jgi:hypothetical protein